MILNNKIWYNYQVLKNLIYKNKNMTFWENPISVENTEKQTLNTTEQKQVALEQKQKRSNDIQKNTPSPDEFLWDLEIKNPEAYKKLIKDILSDKNILEPNLTDKEYINQYLSEFISPLFISNNQENHNNYITHENGMMQKVNYETGFNYALTDEWKVVHYSEMWNSSNWEDAKFIWYWIFWKTDK